ncbi:MAG: response regulator [Desmonostoc vinosum HA7617-LM4]|jgi:DNA-binding response OmpR family regulator|nr:response regulator [Desmonostoc vinosum HA7617-LM4]
MYVEKQLREGLLLQGLQILVAENDLNHQELLTFILEADGAFVILVNSIEEAMEALSLQPPDTILASTNMLEDSQLLAKVKHQAFATGKEILTVALVDTSRSANPIRFLEMGCQTYIRMPLDHSEVVNLVATHTHSY